MRSLLLLVLASSAGCQLYFGSPQTADDIVEPPPADAPPPNVTDPPPPPPSNPPPDAYACTRTGQTCAAEGDTEGCPATVGCQSLIAVGECTCDAQLQWECTPACSDGLCTAADVQAALVGTWEGTVSPPSFSQPWTDHLTIRANGDWSGTCSGPNCLPFYYGGTSGRITVQAQTSVGAYAAIDMGFSTNVLGLLRGVRVTPTTLRFTFIDSWLDCSRPFVVTLHRVP